ncbi:MAG: hypothetical protein ACREA5_06180 [Nitrosotalea sp.]
MERNFVTLIQPLLKRGVSCVGIISKNGRLDEIACKDELPFSKDKKEMFCMSIRLSNSMQHEFDAELQSVYYTVTERGNMKIVSIPVGERVMFSLMDKKKNHIRVIKNLYDIVNDIETFVHPLELNQSITEPIECK